jgi:serine/threonine protein kinase
MKRETPIAVTAIHPNDRSDLMHGVISSVLALHDKGIIHGDIKPANMLLYSDGKIRLCDFAEARPLTKDPADWEGMTTTNYVSPHRCQKNSKWPADGDSAPVVEDDFMYLDLAFGSCERGRCPLMVCMQMILGKWSNQGRLLMLPGFRMRL